MSGYQCSNCNRSRCWVCESAVDERTAIKTIGSRYCEDAVCREAEAVAHGLPLDVMAKRRARWKKARQ